MNLYTDDFIKLKKLLKYTKMNIFLGLTFFIREMEVSTKEKRLLIKLINSSAAFGGLWILGVRF